MSETGETSGSLPRHRLSWSQSIDDRYGSDNQHHHPEGSSQNDLPSSSPQEPATQQSCDILTQTADLTQLGDGDDDNQLLSPLPPFSPTAQRRLPWGRLLPCRRDAPQATDLYPREPTDPSASRSHPASCRNSSPGALFLGLADIRPSQRFNVYTLGRSSKADIVVPRSSDRGTHEEDHRVEGRGDGNDPLHTASQQWAYGMISNRHCFLYCELSNDSSASFPTMQVFIEDTSGNGTVINKTTLLRRNQRRLLHSGDEICLVNPSTLRRKLRDPAALNTILEQYSYVFVNLHRTNFAAATAALEKQRSGGSHHQQQQQQPPLQTPWSSAVVRMMPPPSAKRKPAVDPKATRTHSHYPQSPLFGTSSPVAPARNRANSVTSPNPSSNHNNHRRRLELDYDVRDLLGKGTVGVVRRAIHRQSGVERAVKTIALPRQHRSQAPTDHRTNMFLAEAAILQTLDHPYIVKLIDYYVAMDQVHLVFELCAGGDLFDRIVQKQKYSETEARRVMRRLLAAMHYLHQDKQIAHRDLKPENILLSSRSNDVDILLTDFGLAKTVSSDGLKTFCGTPMYFAPEILQRRHTVMGQGRYGKEADMWSIGIILYILLTGVPPFDPEAVNSTSKIEFPPELWANVSLSAIDLVKQLLIVDPQKRLSVASACVHHWILEEDGDTHCHPLEDPRLVAVHGQQKMALDSMADDDEKHTIGLPIDEDDEEHRCGGTIPTDGGCVHVGTPPPERPSPAGEGEACQETFIRDVQSNEFVDSPETTGRVHGVGDLDKDSPAKESSERSTKAAKVSLGGNSSDADNSPHCKAGKTRAPLELLYPTPPKKTIENRSNDMAISATLKPVQCQRTQKTIGGVKELVEDEIVSDFSDKTESISSFGDVELECPSATIERAVQAEDSFKEMETTSKPRKATKVNSMASSKKRGAHTRSTGESENEAAPKNGVTKKLKTSNNKLLSPPKTAARRKAISGAHFNDENGRQTTLSTYFAKRT